MRILSNSVLISVSSIHVHVIVPAWRLYILIKIVAQKKMVFITNCLTHDANFSHMEDFPPTPSQCMSCQSQRVRTVWTTWPVTGI